MEVVVYFDYDQVNINPEGILVLGRHAQFLVENPTWRVRIEGHADDRGSDGYNLALGERRADAVRQMLLGQGIGDSRIDVISFGEDRPAVDGSSQDARAQNRRAVIIHLSP